MKQALILVFAVLLTAHATLHAADKPNIVFVLYDDMGYGEPKCFREASEFKTPNMDRFAREGMRFTDAHSAAAVCTPTRYGVMTGRYPSRIGQFGVLTTFSKSIIPPTRLTVASLMKQNGYDTACFGKWHLGMDWGDQTDKNHNVKVGTQLKSGPNAAGFDYFYGYTHARNIGTVIEQDKVVGMLKDVETQPRLTKKIVEYLDNPARREKPFFLYLPLCPPHHPIAPAPEFVGKGGGGKSGQYGDWIYQGDDVLGQVLDALDRHKLADNTLIMVSSDNGAANRVYAPLRGAKTSIYEGGHRVPFIARWPGKIKPGSVSDATICLNDLIATCAEIIGAKLPENAGEDSVSILPALLGTAKEPLREATIHQAPNRDLAIRQGPWKLIFTGGKQELYNLQSDMGETRNVADANPEVVSRLTTLMNQYISEGRSTAGAVQKNEAAISIDNSSKAKKNKRGKNKSSQ